MALEMSKHSFTLPHEIHTNFVMPYGFVCDNIEMSIM